MAFDVDYRGYDPEEDDHGIVRGVVLFLAAILAIAVVGAFLFYDSTPAEEGAVEEPGTNYALTLDTSNAAMMHRFGMPTKSDCMEWHVHGQWGWITDGKLHAFDELPGDSHAWDEFYEIDGDNPAFDK